jgi:hypothetical protein
MKGERRTKTTNYCNKNKNKNKLSHSKLIQMKDEL